jgi:hypothetical protein
MVLLPDNGRDPELTAKLRKAQMEAQQDHWAQKNENWRAKARPTRIRKRRWPEGPQFRKVAAGVPGLTPARCAGAMTEAHSRHTSAVVSDA